eukprot:gnl/TRDRNA2_/TRDRNA2_44666_c0_seq1.p1 gnl/TRDRNA2_/TRDRNA2_44666_c0~~gnl/TRDRNA2_/TRDRNA2_44666_c0_seq1.p1  ORF type:complete len:256 (-),score=51.02 gnl/TRDRNA2_/TRDRNA2_44666_c0_seq1:208-975(-)
MALVMEEDYGGLSGADVDCADLILLEQILRECHIHDVVAPSSPPAEPQPTAAAPVPFEAPAPVAAVPFDAMATASSASLQGWRAAAASGASLEECAAAGRRAAALADVRPYSEELLHRLQHCTTPDEARALCSEGLLTFHEHRKMRDEAAAPRPNTTTCGSSAAPCSHAQRLQTLQGANKVIIRALRALSERQKQETLRREQAEETSRNALAELQRCQEQLQASERAKSQLQLHLQLMSSNLSEGPCSMSRSALG